MAALKANICAAIFGAFAADRAAGSTSDVDVASLAAECTPPPGWCEGEGAVMGQTDVDGDGITDYTCTMPEGSTFLTTANGCKGMEGRCSSKSLTCDVATITGNRDCDGDGMPDPFCPASKDYIASSEKCTQKTATDDCKKCSQPPYLCLKGSYNVSTDCDGDGVEDAHCEFTDTAGFAWSMHLSSANDCAPGLYECANTNKCVRPYDFCTRPGEVFKNDQDCDRDGVMDYVCSSQVGVETYIIASATGANARCTVQTGTCITTTTTTTLPDSDDLITGRRAGASMQYVSSFVVALMAASFAR